MNIVFLPKRCLSREVPINQDILINKELTLQIKISGFYLRAKHLFHLIEKITAM